MHVIRYKIMHYVRFDHKQTQTITAELIRGRATHKMLMHVNRTVEKSQTRFKSCMSVSTTHADNFSP